MSTYVNFIINLVKVYLDSFLKNDEKGSTDVISKDIPVVKKEVENTEKEVENTEKEVRKLSTSFDVCFATTSLVTSNFGWRKIAGVYGGNAHFHGGLDFSANQTWGYPCKAIESGRVFKVHKAPGKNGLTYVAIKGYNSGCFFYYCHIGDKNGNKSSLVKVGDSVKSGQVVGFCNKTGSITGPHVHLTVYDPEWNRIDPKCFYDKYAPELSKQIKNYVDNGHIKDNKTNKKCGVL